MVTLNDNDGHSLQCPYCNSEALYKYGRIRTGKQRYLCVMCGKQFTPTSRRCIVKNRPVCPECGGLMHLYKREGDVVRFRCACYPKCKTYFKKMEIKEVRGELLHA